MSTHTINILIPTLNEAGHIAGAVKNALEMGDVFVLDSLSTDGTQQLARDAGAVVVEHAFVNYGAQKNWGLDNLPFTGEWIFILDADERITGPLREEIRQTIASPDAADGYLVNRLMLFMGSTIRHGGYYPSWNLRLFRRGKARYEERSVHEHMICPGPTAFLREEMLHIRNESIKQFIAKHLKYADMEATEWVKYNFGGSQEAHAGVLFQDLLKYRQILRRLVWPRLPMRPLWRFVYMYFWKTGFLDGTAGWRLARLISSYEYVITLLYNEKLLAEERRRKMRRDPAEDSRVVSR